MVCTIPSKVMEYGYLHLDSKYIQESHRHMIPLGLGTRQKTAFGVGSWPRTLRRAGPPLREICLVKPLVWSLPNLWGQATHRLKGLIPAQQIFRGSTAILVDPEGERA